jgi:hypothetical protein
MITRLYRSLFSALALVALVGSGTLCPVSAMASVFRWDIITADSQGNPIPGGQATALADNVSGSIASITLTGSGTFDTSDDDSANITGGGTYVVRGFPEGSIQSSGTYKVTRLLHFEPTPVISGTTILGGLVVLAIKYSDGSKGVLVVNCAINAPPQVTEGVNATKGTVDYWSIQGGFTVFHTGTAF